MRRTIVTASVAILSLVAAGAALIVFLQSGRPKSYRYLIPVDHVGWLCLRLSSPGATSLPTADGFRVVQFDRNGFFETSDSPMPSQSIEQYFWYSSEGTKQLDIGTELGGGYTTWSTEPDGRTSIVFWVSKHPRPSAPLPQWKKPVRCE